MENKPEIQNFNLTKVKLLPGGGLAADYSASVIIKGEASTTDYSVSCNRDVHPDLAALFSGLRSLIARVFQWDGEMVELIEVRGLSWSGKDDNEGIVITALYETANGQKVAINTPRIRLSSESFGFEQLLAEDAARIKSEVYEFLFNGKQAQLSLFGEPVDGGQAVEEEKILLDAEQ